MRWLGVAGGLAGAAGAGYLFLWALALPPSEPNRENGLFWGALWLAAFLTGARLAWTGRRRALTLVGCAATVMAFLGQMTIGFFFLPGAVLTSTAAAIGDPRDAGHRSGRQAAGWGALAGALALAGTLVADWVFSSPLTLEIPGFLVPLTVLVAFARPGAGVPFAAGAAAGFGWPFLALLLWFFWH
ncbi:MAG: hypothetical protein DIU70_004485 [Bacillota bacterium]|nr:MAG: hypothetical protein DIU70_08530 [Bacillota bacterium]